MMRPQRFERSVWMLFILLGSLVIMGCSISWFDSFRLSFVNLVKWEDLINGPSRDVAPDAGEPAPAQGQPEPDASQFTPEADSPPGAAATRAPTCDASGAVSVEVLLEEDSTDELGRRCFYGLYVTNNSSQVVVLSVHVLMFKVTEKPDRGPEWAGHYVLQPGEKWDWDGGAYYRTFEGGYDTYSIVDRIAVTNKSCYPQGMPTSGAEVEPYSWPVQYYCAP